MVSRLTSFFEVIVLWIVGSVILAILASIAWTFINETAGLIVGAIVGIIVLIVSAKSVKGVVMPDDVK